MCIRDRYQRRVRGLLEKVAMALSRSWPLLAAMLAVSMAFQGLPGGMDKADSADPATRLLAAGAEPVPGADAKKQDLAAVSPRAHPVPAATKPQAKGGKPHMAPGIEMPSKSAQITKAMITAVMPAHELRAKHTSKLADMRAHLNRTKEASIKTTTRERLKLNQVESVTRRAEKVQAVLAKATNLLNTSKQHLRKVHHQLLEARESSHRARSAATMANQDLERQLNQHHLSPEIFSAVSDSEQAEGHENMLVRIREKKQAAEDGLDAVAAQRVQLSNRVQEAVDLLDKVMDEQETHPSELNILNVMSARTHVRSVREQHKQAVAELDEIRAKYQLSRDQLRDTELNTLLFEAKAAGSLDDRGVQDLKKLMVLARTADHTFAEAVEYVRALGEEQQTAEQQIKASEPVLRRAVHLLERFKKRENIYPDSGPRP
eukprot:TRINITY_DN13583_c0_g1_i1.p1 TRINITY_DN13583_c0_g1~~TRINITY_DN13583_c0_g1_i1.p1  ORF type:complete len:432 (-),score=146.16 TRINITY_DN13583_c0_g1_i1:251-1546(-)